MSVSVVHPQVQHSHEVVRALEEVGLLDRYYTSCFYNPKGLKFVPKKILNELAKRSNPYIPLPRVYTFPYLDLGWKLSKKLLPPGLHEKHFYYSVWQFDSILAKRIASSSCRIVIGYENSCRDIFLESKKTGKYCVLDAASVHFQAQRKVYTPRYSRKFLDTVNKRKEAEIQLADHILTLSNYAKETYIAAGVPENKISVIPLGVDRMKFSKVNTKKKPLNFSFLFVGNIKLSKGVDLLLEAFEICQIPNKRLIIIGAMGDADFLLKNSPQSILVKGHMDRAQLSNEYSAADVFILPSRLDGFGLVVTESMVSGTPAIVSSHVGAKDLIIDGENGWIFESGNSQSLALAMQSSYQNRDRLNIMGEAAENMISSFSWESYRERIGDFYRRLLKEVP